MNKIIFLDFGVFLHRAIFAWRNTRTVPATYTGLSMIISCLKYIGITPNDIVIIAKDSPKGNWRRELDSNYKANRKQAREKQEDIDWEKMFGDFDRLIENIELSTPFHVIEIDKLEADDIISTGVRLFKDKECIIVSSDSDFEQLTMFENVKIFSPVTKKYKIVDNPYKSIAGKIKKEKTDNLITPITNESEYELRKTLVDLSSLPEKIEALATERLNGLDLSKDFDLSKLWFTRIRDDFMMIYNSDKIVSYAKCYKKKKKPKKKVKKKKNENI